MSMRSDNGGQRRESTHLRVPTRSVRDVVLLAIRTTPLVRCEEELASFFGRLIVGLVVSSGRAMSARAVADSVLPR